VTYSITYIYIYIYIYLFVCVFKEPKSAFNTPKNYLKKKKNTRFERTKKNLNAILRVQK
jgi:hypothetical protein